MGHHALLKAGAPADFSDILRALPQGIDDLQAAVVSQGSEEQLVHAGAFI